MATIIEDLITILKEQIKNYEKLLIISKEKRNYVINNDIKTLQKITSAENIIIGKIQKLENKQEKNIKDIALVLNEDENKITITKIAHLIKNKKDSDNIIKLKNKLKDILLNLKTENDQNKILIQNSLDYIDFSINLIHSHLNNKNISCNNNKIENTNSFFDVKK